LEGLVEIVSLEMTTGWDWYIFEELKEEFQILGAATLKLQIRSANKRNREHRWVFDNLREREG